MDIVNKIGVEKLVAAAAALVTGAAVYMMPQSVLQEAVIASGLPGVLPPLEPPLGGKARIGLALFAAGIAFGLIVTLMGLIGRFAAKPAKKPERAARSVDDLPVPPRVRRRDQHPDAPARAPLLIEQEIGRPGEPVAAEKGVGRRIRTLSREETVPEAQVREPIFAEPAPEPQPQPEPEPIIQEAIADAPEPVIETEPLVREELVGSRPAWLDVPEPSPSAHAPLVELVERLERALEVRTAQRRTAPAPVPPVAAEAEADGTDARLRSALESLKRFAPQRG
jgi:hypothetical protein